MILIKTFVLPFYNSFAKIELNSDKDIMFIEGYHQRWRDYKLPRDYRSLT